MPTFNFFVYLIILAAAYIFKLAYLGWFGQFLLTAVIAAPILLVLMSLPAMLRLKIELKAPPTVERFGEARLAVRFNARSLLPLGKVNVKVETLNKLTGEHSGGYFICRSLSKYTAHLPLSTQDCGVIECRVSSYKCSDLLGLFSIRRKCSLSKTCTVIPKAKAPKSAPSIDAALENESLLMPKHGGGFAEEHDLREYRPGDMPNSIHWKLSSKTDKYIVREPLVSRNNEVYIVLGTQGDPSANLEVLSWLSIELFQREIAHIIVSDDLYPIGNEQELARAIFSILSTQPAQPAAFDRSMARCVFTVANGEVSV